MPASSSSPQVPPPSLSPTAEVDANFFSRTFFHWINPLIRRGSRQPLQQSDLPPVNPHHQAATLVPIFMQTYRALTAADKPRPSNSSPASPSSPQSPASATPRLSRLAHLCPTFILRSTTLRALIPVSFLPFLRAAAIKPLWLLANIAQAYCIRALVDRVTRAHPDPSSLPSRWLFIPVVLALAISAQLLSLSSHHVFAGSMLAGMRARAALSSAIYRKMLRLSPSSQSKVSEGQVANLLINDTQRVLDSYTYANFCWLGFVEIAIISALLTVELGLSAFFGVAILLLLVPVQIWFSSLICRTRANVSSQADKRVQTMTEVLSGIRMVKLSAWEPHFMRIVKAQRGNEMRHLRKNAVLRAMNSALFFVAPVLVSFATFTARTLVFKQPLTAGLVFSTLSFFNTLAQVLNFMPLGWLAISEAIVAGDRLDSFFNLQELQSVPKEERFSSDCKEEGTDFGVIADVASSDMQSQDWSQSDTCDSDFSGKAHDGNVSKQIVDLGNFRVALRHAQFSFTYNNSGEGRSSGDALSDVSVSVSDGELLCVVGSVGSGKSSLLHGILGELLCVGGRVQRHGRTAYCSQQPWIVNGTLRDNITMFEGSDCVVDQVWYNKVVDACCLSAYIDMLVAGDHTEIGERGVNLSGGQKARVALARAVYSNADIYLLDDPLSAVDPAVMSRLIQKLFSKDGLLAGKAVIVVTHQMQLLPLSTEVIVLKSGRVYQSGPFEELIKKGVELSGFYMELDDAEEGPTGVQQEVDDFEEDRILNAGEELRLQELLKNADVDIGISEITGSEEPTKSHEGPKTAKTDFGAVVRLSDTDDPPSNKWGSPEKIGKTGGELVSDEDRCTGRVPSSVYKAYIEAGGGIVALIALLLAFALPQALRQISEWWLSRWSTCSDCEGSITQNRFHALVFLGFAVGTALLTLFRAGLFGMQTMTASQNMHNKLLERILRAKVSFFDTNPIGRILNRFSKDVDHMDVMLPVTAQDCLQIFFVALGAVVTISWILPWFLIPLAPLVCAFFFLQHYYKMSSRELKRIDGVSRSLIYAHFVETTGGISTIRAFESTERFCDRFNKYVDGNNCSYHMFTCVGRWLGVRLDALATAIVFCTGLVVLIVSPGLDAGLAGVALTQSILTTNMLQWGVRQAAETENHFTSVERIATMATQTPTEKAFEAADGKPPESWPAEGVVSFHNVELSYRPELDPALQNLSFKTKGSERIGIVGRTGSGKSSLFVALFRMVELSKGAISIDGVNIGDIGLQDLRSRMAIVPQDPVLFNGTIRSNLDPLGIYSDAELWDAVHRVHMSHALEGATGDMNGDGHGLDMVVCEKGSNFSAGERQLLSLARAILSGVKIVVLDEASASLDNRTDILIQKTIREQLMDCTVLTIAHRLATIADSDRVLVMDAGEMVEFDTPAKLLQQRGFFARLVEETGRVESAILKAIIKEASGAHRTTVV